METGQGTWRAPTVVLACGAATLPAVPPLARLVPDGITCLTPAAYRNPGQLPEGGVLVIGASASGIQLADELARSGRPVTLAVGEHVRMPRTYRGQDILWWLDAAGVLDQRYDEAGDLAPARNVPSMELVGTAGRTVDLNALGSAGVRLVGRLAGIADGAAQFSGSLAAAAGHLRTILAQYEAHYNGRRPHRSRELQHPVADLSRKQIKRRVGLGASSTNASGPHRRPGQDRWPSSGTLQARDLRPRRAAGCRPGDVEGLRGRRARARPCRRRG